MSQHDQHTPETPRDGQHEWPAPEYAGDNVNAGLIGMVGVFATVVFLLIVVLVQAWFYTWKAEFAAEKYRPADDPQSPLGLMLSEQQAQIGSYHWVDRKAGVRAIPVERAMTLVADEMAAAQKKSSSEVKHDHRGSR